MNYKKIGKNEFKIMHGLTFYNGESYTRKISAYKRSAKDIETHTKEEWYLLCSKYDYKCCKCGSEVIGGIPTKDHIIPITLGGSDSIDNIQPLCRQCNTSKGQKILNFRTRG